MTNRFSVMSLVIGAGLAGVTVLTGCSVPAKQPIKDFSKDNDRPLYRFVGRVQPLPLGQARYAWSGAGLVARFRGTGAVVRLKDDKNEHQVVVDGVSVTNLVTKQSTERYSLVSGLPLGEHRLEIYRRTEALFGPTTFLGLEIEAGELLLDTLPLKRRIEVVGDSVSCGYGNLGSTPDCKFSPETENHYESYGAVLARTFGAELSTIAWSGRGVVKNYGGGPGEKMGTLYDRILPEVTSTRWEPATTYQVVIVNLGTNDFSTDTDPEERDFVSAYVELLGKIRRNSPEAYILCTVGPMLGGEDLEKAERGITQAVEQRKSTGDKGVLAYRMTTANQNPGCDYHPAVATHRQMAEELAVPIRAALGW
jgi:lysophospholipase L1-like esterase